MNITPNMLKDAILTEDDFGHEMRVRQVLEDVPNAKVVHGWTFTDPLEGKPRQFDFRFTLRTPQFSRLLQLAIECKNLAPEAPLVVCGTDRAESEAFHYVAHSWRSERDAVGNMRSSSEVSVQPETSPDSFYKPDEFVGKSLLRLKPDQKDPKKLSRASAQESEIYGRWSQALASADELCKNSARHKLSQAGRLNILTLPCVVVPDGVLWECHYNSDGSLKSVPYQVNHTSFFINHSIRVSVFPGGDEKFILSHIHFLTLSGLKRFVAKLAKGDEPVPHDL